MFAERYTGDERSRPAIRSFWGKWLRRLVVALIIAYPVALVIVALLLRFVGEDWWATGVALYLPRIGFALPLPVLVVAQLLLGLRKLWWVQLVAVVILVFPLMGMVMSFPRSVHEGEPVLRVLSFNVDSGYWGNDKIDAEIEKRSPDIVLLQEVQLDAYKLADVLRSRYAAVESSGQFIVASRFPILSAVDPDRLPHYGRMRSPRFMHYVIETPLGRIAFYHVHPVSPRSVFYEMRGKGGLKREILSGHILSGAAAPDVDENNRLRALQIQSASELAANETYPVIIAGDTNLPGLSHVFGRYLSNYQDGFAKVGWGFGYTFQAYRRWMRLDRILAGPELRFTSFQVGCSGASDHLCVVADLQRERP
jgi:endonuclease/exonuclease/phosphatase family metal-dependent hydrolase